MFFPMFAMVVLTFIVAGFAINSRFKSVMTKQLSIKYFQIMQGDDVPISVSKSTRCFNNLFEVPTLFYVVCSLYIIQEIQSVLAFVLAWCFVCARIIQASVHISYNNVIHRMLAFWISCFFVLGLWINLLLYFL